MKNLNELSIKELVELYNKYAEKPVKKFRDKATAVERVSKILPKPKKASTKTNINEAAFIKLTVTKNPKRKSSKCYKRFEKYITGEINTVKEYLEEVGRAQGLRDLNWDIAKGFLTLTEQKENDS